jgi:hypothetical protein
VSYKFELNVINKGRNGLFIAHEDRVPDRPQGPPITFARVKFQSGSRGAIESMEFKSHTKEGEIWVEIQRLTDEELLSMIRRLGELIGDSYSEAARVLLDYLNEELGRRV